jgi:hypothetical protein
VLEDDAVKGGLGGGRSMMMGNSGGMQSFQTNEIHLAVVAKEQAQLWNWNICLDAFQDLTGGVKAWFLMASSTWQVPKLTA